MSALLPEINREFTGISDSSALHVHIDNLSKELDATASQLAHERALSSEVHRARTNAIVQSEALKLVFGIDGDERPESSGSVSVQDQLSSAFLREVSTPGLPEGFAATMAKFLRVTNHPDAGGNTEVSQDIAHKLSKLDKDPGFSIASAVLSASKKHDDDPKLQRIERYRLHLALAGLGRPLFESEKEAEATAKTEINGAAWRVRTQAAFKSLELITGGADIWSGFLHNIAQTRQMQLINMVNREQPPVMRACERLIKGEPIAADALDITVIDAVFERIWSTLGPSKEGDLPYAPPYQNWLKILLPALRLLDPGEKPGEQYTLFEPPITIERVPAPAPSRHPRYDRSSLIGRAVLDNQLYDKYNNQY